VVRILCLLLAGCGRLGFDPVATTDTQTDAPGDVADAPPGAGCVSEVVMQSNTTCALTTSGQVWCWGANDRGEVGDGSLTDRLVPTRTQLPFVAVQISLGSSHGCARGTAGEPWCWGDNTDGELGDGTITARPMPGAVTVEGALTMLALGSHFTCGRRANGVIVCWGRNDNGQLGNGTTAGSRVPVIVGGAGEVIGMTAANYTTCVRRSSLDAACWGRNEFGQFGNGGTANSTIPVASGFSVVSEVMASGTLTDTPTTGQICGRMPSGALSCAGGNDFGQLGDMSMSPRSTPFTVPIAQVHGMGVGTYHTCAIVGAQRAVQCWGRNHVGQLGRGTKTPFELGPAEVLGLSAVTKLVGGRVQTCALLSDATVRCWGGNVRGEVGDGTGIDQPAPVQVDVPCS